MPKTVYYVAQSLDGYIAEPEEKLQWLMKHDGPPYEGEDAIPLEGSYETFMERIGSLAMGAKTYEFLLREDTWTYGDMPTWVFTHRDLPAFEDAAGLRFTQRPVSELHGEMLAAAGGKDLWMIGGGSLASQFVEVDALDELILTVVPVVLGDGYPLFAGPVPPMKLTGSTRYDNGMVELRYDLPSSRLP